MHRGLSLTSKDKETILRRMRSYVEDVTPEHHKHLAWKKAAEDIKTVTGYYYPYDSLRQNLDSTNKAKNEPRREIQDPERWGKLIQFLTEVGYLSEEIEDIAHSAGAAPQFLRDFLEYGEAERGTDYFSNLEGVFQGELETEHYVENVLIDYRYLEKSRVVELSALIERQNYTEEVAIETSFAGWGISKDEFCIFVLRSERSAEPRCFLVLQSLPSLDAGKPYESLALISYAGGLPGALNKSSNNLAVGDDTRSAEAFEITSYSLSPSTGVPIIFLTRHEKESMTKKDKAKVKPKRRHFAPPAEAVSVNEKAVDRGKEKLRDQWEWDSVDFQFVMAVRTYEYEKALELLPRVGDINRVDCNRRETALHVAANRNLEEFIAVMEQRRDLNYCVRDREGLLPSDMAAIGGHGELADELSLKEKAYAQEHDINLYPLPPVAARKLDQE